MVCLEWSLFISEFLDDLGSQQGPYKKESYDAHVGKRSNQLTIEMTFTPYDFPKEAAFRGCVSQFQEEAAVCMSAVEELSRDKIIHADKSWAEW